MQLRQIAQLVGGDTPIAQPRPAQPSPASQQVQLQLAAGEFRATKNQNRHNKTSTQNEALNFGKFTRSITIGYILYTVHTYTHIIPTGLWQLNSRAHYVPHTHTHSQGKTPPTKQQQVTKLQVSFFFVVHVV